MINKKDDNKKVELLKAIKTHVHELCDFDITDEEIENNIITLMRIYKKWILCNDSSDMSNICPNGGYHEILSKDVDGHFYTKNFRCPKLANNPEFVIRNNFYYTSPDIVNEYQRLRKEEIWCDETKYSKRTDFLNLLLNFKKDYDHTYAKGIYVQGEANSGKSYILMAFCNEMAVLGKTVVYITANSLDLEIKQSIGDGSTFSNDIVDTMIACDILVIDELGAEQFKANTHGSVLANVINYRSASKQKKLSIFSSKYSLKDLNKVYSNYGKNENVTSFVNKLQKTCDTHIYNITPIKLN